MYDHTLLYYYIIIDVSICPSQWQLHGSMVVMRIGFYLVFLSVAMPFTSSPSAKTCLLVSILHKL